MIKFSQLQSISGGSMLQYIKDSEIISLCIDSRKAGIASGTLFFAIRGERHDGHDHIESLYDQGVRQFVTEHPIDLSNLHESNVLVVNSSVEALQRLVVFHRGKFKIPVIGITGSNGKTIIKEWLYQMLSFDKVIVKNPGSYNSQVGVPLAVWQMQGHHELGIFEAGISKPGEMERLEKIIQPSIGLLTNIGSAHDEGFKDQQEKILEKLKLFRHCDVLIYCCDQSALDNVIQMRGLNTFVWGSQPTSDVQVTSDNGMFSVVVKGQSYSFEMPFQDKASRENLIHCLTVMLYLGYRFTDIRNRIESLRSVPMRMEVKEGINNCQIIDDTYNNDLGGLEIALQFLEHQNQKKNKRLILSDILESGLPDNELVAGIVRTLEKYAVSSFIGVGEVLRKHKNSFIWPSEFYDTTEQFIDNFNFEQLRDETILVKGARKFSFEKIVSRLQRKVHGTVMEIDLDALTFNFNYFKSLVKPTTKVMVMVKAFAYGSGLSDIGNLLQYHQADYLGVAYPDEGIELRKNNIKLPIMVMNPSEESFDALLANMLEPEIYSLRIFKSLINFLRDRPCKVHIKIDTGMHRLGFEPDHLDTLINLLKGNPNIQVASIFSHLAGADESSHDSFSASQFEVFTKCATAISHAIGYKPLYHILNTPGILRLSDFQMDMVRLGIGLYGVNPTQEGFYELRPVATLKTIISQIKYVKKGNTIGYGRHGVAEKDIVMGTIAIGYADGFSRAFSRGVGYVLVNGKKAPVVGNVCMDMTMIDLTGIEASEGDDVTIFGKGLPIRELSSRINTIPYELLTSTSERVKRVFTSDGI
ncbi:MAG: bifunctional UDP-N-acetylmuramoyl-tripeptide:D-alanyl-D-alanine ligase/alanine racemase [Chryseolinea sp.]